MAMITAFLGRLLIATMFIVQGLRKVVDPTEAAAMLTGAHLPANWAQPVGWFEIVAGLMLAIGVLSRFVALVLFVFTAATIFYLHNQINVSEQATLALKNVAIMGGLLMVVAYGQMRWSYDHWRLRNKATDLEIRAARAEGKAEGLAAAPAAAPVVAPPAARTAAIDTDGDGRADSVVRT